MSSQKVDLDNDVKMREAHEIAEETKVEGEMNFRVDHYESTDELFGQIYGIERTIIIDQADDTLLNLIEKIALIPENKLVLVEPLQVPLKGGAHPRIMSVPKVKGVISIYDVFAKLLSNEQ